jgi:hypothetical protein
MADDVKVRLSAEGVQDVIAAFKSVQTAAETTGKHGKESVLELGHAFETLGDQIKEAFVELLPLLTVLAVAEKFKDLASEAYNSAITLGKLSDATGMSAGQLQALQKVADETSVSQEALNKGLTIFTRTVGQAEMGSKKAQTAFKALFGSEGIGAIKDLKPDEQLQAVAAKLEEIHDPAQRAAEASLIFGKNAAEILPVLKELAEGGVGGVKKELEALGVAINDDTIAQVQAAHKAFDRLKLISEGLATQFMVGLMPAVTAAAEEIAHSMGGSGANAMKTFGEVTGRVIRAVIDTFIVLGRTVSATVSTIVSSLETVGTAIAAPLKALEDISKGRGLAAAGADLKNGWQSVKSTWGDTGSKWAGLLDGLGKPIAPAKREKGDGGGGGLDLSGTLGNHKAHDYTDQINKARQELIQAQLDAELKLYEAHSKALEAQDKEQYETGKISLAQYYDDRETFLKGRLDRELAIIQQKLDAAKSRPVSGKDPADAIKKQTEILKLESELATKREERESSLAQLAGERHKEEAAALDRLQNAQIKILEIEGDQTAAARAKLDIEMRQLEVELRKAGIQGDELKRTLADARTQGSAKVNYDAGGRQLTNQFRALDDQIKSIQNKVASGQLFPIQGEQAIINLEKQRLPELQRITAEMLRQARIADPDDKNGLVSAAEAQAEKVKQLATATDTAGLAMAKLKGTAQQALQDGIANMLTDILTGAKNVGDAFRGLAVAFLEAIMKMEAEALAARAVKAITSLIGGGGFAGGGEAVAAATGGYISGPGTSTSDSIPARLSDGEFVVNAKAVAQPGMREMLHAINGTPGFSRNAPGRVAAFASGGLVSAAGGGGSVIHQHVDATGIDPKLIHDAVRASVLDVIAKNPAHVRNALG